MASPLKKWCVKKVHSDSFDSHPVILSFSNGLLQLESRDSFQFRKFVNKESASNLLVAQKENASYAKGKFRTENEHKYCVGVLDTKSNKMIIYESEFYQLEPQLTNSLSTNEKNGTTSNREKSDALTEAFGSKAKRRTMESRKRHVVESEEMGNIIIKTALETNLPELNQKKEDNEMIGINWDATELNQVYDVKQIISQSELDAMDDAALEFSTRTGKQMKKVYCPFIMNYLETIKSGTSDDRTKMVLYLNYLLDLYTLNSSTMRRKDPLPNYIPTHIKDKLLDMFTQSIVGKNGRTYRTCPMNLKDKLLAHICVLSLIINNYNVDLDLIPDVKITGNSRYRLLMRMIGITYGGVERGKLKNVMEVKLPLVKLSETRMQKRK